MTQTLIERLRFIGNLNRTHPSPERKACAEAADELERLAALPDPAADEEDAVKIVTDVIWPLQDWNGERWVAESAAREVVAALGNRLTGDEERLREALTDIHNRILCPVGPAPTLEHVANIASEALVTRPVANELMPCPCVTHERYVETCPEHGIKSVEHGEEG